MATAAPTLPAISSSAKSCRRASMVLTRYLPDSGSVSYMPFM